MKLSVVVPHWSLDDEVDEALRRCLASPPENCEKLVVVNEGTGFARNVNIGLRLASGDFVGVTGNDAVVVEGNVYDLCKHGAVASPGTRARAPALRSLRAAPVTDLSKPASSIVLPARTRPSRRGTR